MHSGTQIIGILSMAYLGDLHEVGGNLSVTVMVTEVLQ